MTKDKSAKLNKKKNSRETTRLLAEGYKENAEEDLAIAKDFEAAENELEKNCDK
ncbi:MAG: hypothetical protein ABSF44_15670 [Candidatus Bathyarchaeia archaeon]|jgi:hypothetical protein